MLFASPTHEFRDPGDRGLTDARKDEQASPWRTSEVGRKVAIEACVCGQESARRPWDRSKPVKVFGRAPLDWHRQDLERSGDRVVQLACRRDRRVALLRPQEIEVDRRDLEGPKELRLLSPLLGGSPLDEHGNAACAMGGRSVNEIMRTILSTVADYPSG